MAVPDHSLDGLVMPSKWVVRSAPEEAVPRHVRLITAESERVRGGPGCRLGVSCGPQPGDTVDLFNEKTCTTGRLVAFLSGGYWQV